MTLILTALSKNGICVCADRRNTKPDSTHENSLYKIYLFKNIPLIIFNHGVNKFNNKSWNEYCSEYEKSGRWENHNLYEISDDFKKFVEKDIELELQRNFHKGLTKYTTTAFDFCGKTVYNVNFKRYELFWTYDSGGLRLERPPLGKLVLSGDGKNYLKSYLDKNGNINKDRYWENLDITQAKNELERLFSVAAKEQKRLVGNEFSDEFDFECISK